MDKDLSILSLKGSRLSFCLLLAVLLSALVFTGSGVNAAEPNYLTSLIRLELTKDLYHPGEPVEIDLVLVNRSPETVTYVMAHNVKIYDSGDNIIWEKDFVIYGKMILEPNSEALLIVFTWDQKDKDGSQVENGTYRISVRLWEDNVEGQTTIQIGEREGAARTFDFLYKIFQWFRELWS